MARVQLALNVSDLNEAIAFYTKLFGRAPAKVQPGYANFAITDPPLKLVLVEDPDSREAGVVGALNHLGVEVATPGEVGDASRRLQAQGLETEEQQATTCCYAVQDKVWVAGPRSHAMGDLHGAGGCASREHATATVCVAPQGKRPWLLPSPAADLRRRRLIACETSRSGAD